MPLDDFTDDLKNNNSLLKNILKNFYEDKKREYLYILLMPVYINSDIALSAPCFCSIRRKVKNYFGGLYSRLFK